MKVLNGGWQSDDTQRVAKFSYAAEHDFISVAGGGGGGNYVL